MLQANPDPGCSQQTKAEGKFPIQGENSRSNQGYEHATHGAAEGDHQVKPCQKPCSGFGLSEFTVAKEAAQEKPSQVKRDRVINIKNAVVGDQPPGHECREHHRRQHHGIPQIPAPAATTFKCNHKSKQIER